MPDFISAAEAARRLSLCRTAVLALIGRGRLRSAQPHAHAPHRIDPVAVESLAAERARTASARRAITSTPEAA